MKLSLKEVHGDDVIPFYRILMKCGEEMYINLNLSHWHPFMDEQSFRDLIKNKRLYGIYKDNNPIATFNISTQARDYYCDSLWNIPADAGKALYLGQLATDPTQQCKGIGKWCMGQVELIAKEMGCTVIRCDALKIHPWLKNFYVKLGYLPCGTVKPGQWDLLCFEKHIS